VRDKVDRGTRLTEEPKFYFPAAIKAAAGCRDVQFDHLKSKDKKVSLLKWPPKVIMFSN